ncbi:E3 ubiquitin-protein ligase rnf8-like isoform X1 [Pieris brassicae]|uniref:E3 ubiquitin-protein ligase rnf8-like isoform X1 n=1 Tax=Pieris brassicae TaxID=7116 RepID=UPI001E65E89F|nr:E3 ubiquitin-protein ligase rnf8-like isoform X1 [Pieris brassicae]
MQNNRPVLVSCKRLRTELNRFRKIHITSDDSFTLGRGLHNTLVIPSLVISRSHCKFRKENCGWVIEDSSACGIEVNGVKVGKGNSKNLINDDIVRLDALQEFVYKFIWPHNDIAKRIKFEKDENSSILDDVKIKFEESQNIEMQHIEDKIQKQKQLQVANKLLQDQLYAKKNIKVEELERSFGVQIENLKGEKNEVQMQKILLIKERDAQISSLKKEMDTKINKLMDQIKMHNETEAELAIENNSLKTKLQKEREEFLAELDKENTSKHELLDRLHQKIKEQEEQRLKEKQELENEFRIETEKLRLAKDQEMLALVELNKQRELELLEEHKKIKQRLEKEISDMKKESKNAEIQLLHKEENVSQAPSAQMKVVGMETEHQETKNGVSDENPAMAGPSYESSKPLADIGQMMETELQCSICAEIFICPVMLSCGHTFCKYCINLWKKNKKDCPICRTPIKYESRSIVVDSFIEKILPNLSEEMKKKREESLKIREEEETLPSPGASAQNSRRATAESESEAQWDDTEGEEFPSSEGDATDVFDDYYIFRPSILDQYYSSARDSHGGSDFNSDPDSDDDVTTGSNSCRRRRQRVPGTSGSYYGGYGRCYRCGAKGHWAPGCPNRL